MDPTGPRIVLFGGQGSSALFSPLAALTIQKDAEASVSGLILASKCHAAFLEELSSLDGETKRLLGVDIAHFYALKDFLVPSHDYHQHGLVQSTTLCLYQLLHYLAEIERSGASFGSSLDRILETTGFCAGLIPAVVVAASDTAEKFVRFGVEAFRLSFWIGCRATAASRRVLSNQLPEQSWSLVVLGLDREQVAERLREFDERVSFPFDLTDFVAHWTSTIGGCCISLLFRHTKLSRFLAQEMTFQCLESIWGNQSRPSSCMFMHGIMGRIYWKALRTKLFEILINGAFDFLLTTSFASPFALHWMENFLIPRTPTL